MESLQPGVVSPEKIKVPPTLSRKGRRADMFWRRISSENLHITFYWAHLGKLRGLLLSSGFCPDLSTAKGVRTMRGRRGRCLYSTCARSQEHREGEMIDIFCRVSERRREEQNNCQVRFPSRFREVMSSQSHNVRNDKYHEGISEILPRVLMSIRNPCCSCWLGPKINFPLKASWGGLRRDFNVFGTLRICTENITPIINIIKPRGCVYGVFDWICT